MKCKDITAPAEQKQIAIWSTIVAAGIAGLTALLGKTEIALGVGFGSLLMILNYWAMSLVPWIYQKLKTFYCGKVAACIYYYSRFWLLILILFLVIPRSGYNFAMGCFLGFIIPKIVMGARVITGAGEDWWLHREKAPAETNLGPEKRDMTPLERELSNTNPFEFDIVDFEWHNYMKKESNQ